MLTSNYPQPSYKTKKPSYPTIFNHYTTNLSSVEPYHPTNPLHLL